MLIKNFGDPNSKVARPFLAFYNKYTGKIRVFLWLGETPTSPLNGGGVKMVPKNKKSALFANAQPISTSVLNFPKDQNSISPSTFINQDGFWIYADFNTAYDPCICKYPSKLEFKLKLLDEYQLQLNGVIGGKIAEIIDQNNGVNTGNGFKSNFIWDDAKSAYEAGQKAYKSGNKFANSAKSLIDSNASFLEDDMDLEIENLKELASGIPYVSTAIGIFDFFVGGGGQKKQDLTPTAFEADLQFQGDGSLHKTNPFGSHSFSTPGSRPDYPPEGENNVPYYNNPLGVFNLLEQPKLEYVDYEPEIQFPSVPIKENRYSETLKDTTIQVPNIHTPLPNIRQIKPVGDIKYALNPASGLKIEEIEAAVQVNYKDGFSQFKETDISKLISTNTPKPVEFVSEGEYEDNIRERLEKSNFKIERWPKNYPDNAEMVSLRSPYVSLSCIDKQSLFLHVYDNEDLIAGADINLKLKIVLERKDGQGQEILMVLTYDFDISENEESQNTTTEYDFDFYGFYEATVWGDGDTTFWAPRLRIYPKKLISGNNSGPFLAAPMRGVSENVVLENETVNKNVKAFNNIIVDGNVTINSGNNLRAGNKIEINGANNIENNVILSTDGPIPSCGNPVGQYQATPPELTAFCKDDGEYEKRTRMKKSPIESSPKAKTGIFRNFKASLAPNPVNNVTHLTLELPKSTNVEVAIKGLSGKTVKNQIVNETFDKGPQKISLNTTNLRSGFYLCTIQTKFGRKTLKFVKQ